MNLLLDTHIFIWLSESPHKLTPAVQSALQNSANRLFLSTVSVWEMQIKVQIGKLDLPLPVKEFVILHRTINQIESLPVIESHIWILDDLPLHHKDPFDRILIAQSISEQHQLVSTDSVFEQYPVQRFL